MKWAVSLYPGRGINLLVMLRNVYTKRRLLIVTKNLSRKSQVTVKGTIFQFGCCVTIDVITGWGTKVCV